MNLARPVLTSAVDTRNAAYDIVLLAHVLAALIGLVVVAVAGGSAFALGRSGRPSEALRRYYRPGVNWAGRVLFLVPVLGATLIAMSGGEFSYADAWVVCGLAIWLVAACLGEMVLWPAERRLQAGLERGDEGRSLATEWHRAAVAALVICVLLVVAAVVMVAKP